ncbi:MAG: uncharacterized protein A8A55_1778 [Amphiamblys sp. WSBS2006]|nr:MAG: uncharacterized protein A8A55_1778 [Amphiamblys sp. WSBS2006]
MKNAAQKINYLTELFSSRRVAQLCNFVFQNQPLTLAQMLAAYKNSAKTKRTLLFLAQQQIVTTRKHKNTAYYFLAMPHLLTKNIFPFFVRDIKTKHGDETANIITQCLVSGTFFYDHAVLSQSKVNPLQFFTQDSDRKELFSVNHTAICEYLLEQTLLSLIEIEPLREELRTQFGHRRNNSSGGTVSMRQARDCLVDFVVMEHSFRTVKIDYPKAVLFVLKELLGQFLEERYGRDGRRVFGIVLEESKTDTEISQRGILSQQRTGEILFRLLEDSFVTTETKDDKDGGTVWHADLDGALLAVEDFLLTASYKTRQWHSAGKMNEQNATIRKTEMTNTLYSCFIHLYWSLKKEMEGR